MNEDKLQKIRQQVNVTFDPIRTEMDELSALNKSLVFDYESRDGNRDARSHVAKLRKVKTRITEAHKIAKAEALEVGRVIDGVKRDYLEEMEAIINVHYTPIREIEEREAKIKAEEEARIQHEKDEVDRKAREEMEAKQAEIDRRMKGIADREQEIKRKEDEAAEKERIAKMKADAEEKARREYEAKKAQEALQPTQAAIPTSTMDKPLASPVAADTGDVAVFSYGHGGALVCDRYIDGLTQRTGEYGGWHFVCETIMLSAAKIIAAALGGKWKD